MTQLECPRFSEAVKDAGLLREYLAIRYGQVFIYGGSADTFFRGIRIAKLLARITGLSLDEVMDAAKSDAEVFYGEEN